MNAKNVNFGYTSTATKYRGAKKISTKTIVANPLVSALENQNNLSTTENGAVTYKSTLNSVLDFFGQGAALRTRSDKEVIQLFSKAFAEDKLLALKTLYYIRDIRGGQGERKTFRTILNYLAQYYPDIVRKNFLNIPLFGRYDDFYALIGTSLENEAFEIMKNQLSKDWFDMKAKKNVSLLAKWLKSENTSSKDSVEKASKFRKYLGWTSKKYRKTLSQLRNYIDVVEVKMCAGQWSEIDFEKVPSKASLNYRKAFEKQAKTEYTEYLGKVEKGESKINASALYPYDILRALVEASQTPISIKSADLQWKALPNYVEEGGSGICVCDVSGSMDGLPLYVSISLGIYFAERNVGPFKDVFMTFSNTPRFNRIVGNNLLEKWDNFNRDGWDMNTDLISVFKLILDTAVKNKVSQKDLPSKIFIISDMEFDACTSSHSKTSFETIDQMFKKAGYKRPDLVFWNVNSRNNNCPIKSNEVGACLVSGASPSILKSVLSGKVITPIDIMMETITNNRYDSVVV